MRNSFFSFSSIFCLRRRRRFFIRNLIVNEIDKVRKFETIKLKKSSNLLVFDKDIAFFRDKDINDKLLSIIQSKSVITDNSGPAISVRYNRG